MGITVQDLKINGITMPAPALEGLTISSEKIWSSDTGRTAAGKMVGTIVAIKTTVSIQWPVLTMDQVELIESVVSDSEHPFVPLTYTDMTGQTVTKQVYFGTPSYTIYSYADGIRYVQDVTVDGIEQ